MRSFLQREANHARTCSRVATTVALAALLSAALAPVAGASPATRLADDTAIHHAVTLAGPAVVRIVSVVDGGLICHSCANDGSDIVSPANGAFEFETAGTGAFISSDGYILTADHVVDNTNSNPLDTSFIYQQALQDIAQRVGNGVQPSDVDTFLKQHASAVEIAIQQKSQEAFLSTAYTGQLQDTAQVTGFAVTRIVSNSPVEKQDTAIIKIEAQDLPYVTLAPNSAVSAGDNVTAIGFPADADEVLSSSGDFTSLLSPTQSDVNTINSLLTASVETGQVTSQKTLADGTPVYETNGIANHGSSGGPVIDNQGNIIGFVDTGSSGGRVVNLISSSVASEYAQQAGVATPKPGNFEALWTKSVNEYDATGACHWTNAYHDLNKLHQQYPNFGAVSSLLSNAQNKATPQECPAPSNSSGLVFGGLGILVLLIIASVGAYLFVRRRQQRLQPTPVAVGAGYSAMYASPQLGAPPRMPTATPMPGGGTYGQPTYPTPGTTPYPAPISATPPTPGYTVPSVAPTPTPPAPAHQPYTPPSQPAQPMGVAYSLPQTPAPNVHNPTNYNPVEATAPNAADSAPRVCPSGHEVHEVAAHFCPVCGAPLPPAPNG